MTTGPWIENCSLDDVRKGWHFDPGENSLLISIVDVDMEHPRPKYPFREVIRCKFDDVEEHGPKSLNAAGAARIANALDSALRNHTNVIVHCVAGICRSGAVVEAGIARGFRDTDKTRIPNVLVKKMLMPMEPR